MICFKLEGKLMCSCHLKVATYVSLKSVIKRTLFVATRHSGGEVNT